ncbi:putative bifunctional diguanylate cyclase/phosphodiesterase [Paraburkholderia heleia]|uniref:putative bifunctional diguanylate cyclase/phosphodiesterase n=1 Tax=Paraburkholderia heleia TaxID=634127 RepID=UPI0005A6A3F1|nr:EAL domain-containing protein [Paraburkholderia heleia]
MRGQLQRTILDMLARGRSVQETAVYICVHAEEHAAGVLCSIVTVDRDGILHPFAEASISAEYTRAMDGLRIGPDVGSCGSAAFLRKPIAVHDIFSDPRWAAYQALTRILFEEHGVKACWSSPILQSDGRVLGAFGFYYRENRGPTDDERLIVEECVDICALILEREEVRADNWRLANFDQLTALGNRANFIKSLERAVGSANRSAGILLIDIDHLGRINNAFGHAVGDELILEVSRMITQHATRESSFRIDADEFAVLIEGDNVVERLPSLARHILADFTQRPPLAGPHAFPLSVSCGGANFDHDRPLSVPTFLQHATLALNHAKQAARGDFVLYTESLAGPITRRVRVLQALAEALAEDRLKAHYQPIVSLETGEIIGLEALCRVRTGEGKIIPAAVFAEALNDRPMGYLVTERMLEHVARDTRHWLDQSVELQYVGVNISMADFDQRDLRVRIKDVLSRYDVPFGHIVLEVNESVYMDDGERKVSQMIGQLRTDGLMVALDDFGTGYASLTHLLNFPVDIIKIDKSFVDKMSVDGAGALIIKALLDVAAGLGIRIIAEGVETADQALNLQRLGCSFAQGYLFGRPADRDSTTETLLRQHWENS